jgi:hypothetical protein
MNRLYSSIVAYKFKFNHYVNCVKYCGLSHLFVDLDPAFLFDMDLYPDPAVLVCMLSFILPLQHCML